MKTFLDLAAIRAKVNPTGDVAALSSFAASAGARNGVAYNADISDMPLEAGKLPVSIQFEDGKYATWNMSWADICAEARVIEDHRHSGPLAGLSHDSVREEIRTAILAVFGSNGYLKPDNRGPIIMMVCWLLATGEPGRQLKPHAGKLKSVGFTISRATPTEMRFRLCATLHD